MNKQRALLAVGGALLILAVGVWAWVAFGPVRYSPLYFFTLLNAPPEVKDMLFVLTDDTTSSLVRIRLGGLEVQDFEGALILGVERASDKTSVLVLQQGSGAIDVARIEDGTLVSLTDDGEKKGGIAFSPDGGYFAYTALALPISLEVSSETQSETPYSPNEFRVHVYNRAGTFVESFSGNHPFFLDNETLGFFSEVGIETKNLKKGDVTYIKDDITSLAEERPYFGRNNTMIVRNPVTQELMVFEFISTPPLVYQLVGTLPDSTDGFALSRDKTVYQGVVADGLFTIRAITNFEQPPETIFSIPSSFFKPTNAVF